MRKLRHGASLLAAASTTAPRLVNAEGNREVPAAGPGTTDFMPRGQHGTVHCKTAGSSAGPHGNFSLGHERLQNRASFRLTFSKLPREFAARHPLRCDLRDRVAVQLRDLRTCGGGEKEFNAAYDMSVHLGKGGFGTVRKGTHKYSGLARAIKRIHLEHPTAKDWNAVLQEVEAMMDLDHPNVARLFEYFKTDEDLLLAVEFCAGGSLEERLAQKGGKFSFDEAMVALRHMLRATLCCHMHGLVHRDLKPSNFCYASTECKSALKLIDFGLSRSCELDRFLQYQAGTLDHCAPEVLQDRQQYGPAADVWSIGVIFYLLLTGKPLVDLFSADANLRRYFGGKSVEQEAVDFICDADHIKSKLSTLREDIPGTICDLLERMLHPDPAARITVVQALMHPAIIESFVKHPRGQAAFDPDVVPKMRKFISAPAIKRLAVLVEAHLLCPEDDQLLREEYLSFRVADKDGDGVVSVAEFSEALQSVGATVPGDLATICRKIDVLQDGVITYTEFMAAAMDPRVYQKEAFCKAVFRILDADADGRITARDLETVLKPSNRRRTIAEAILMEVSAPSGLDFNGYLRLMLS